MARRQSNDDKVGLMTVRRRTRRIVSVIAAVIAAVSVCAAPIGAQRARDTHAPVTLTWFMWSSSPQEVTAWQWDAALVTKVYPWIHVKFVTAQWTAYWNKLQAEVATGGL